MNHFNPRYIISDHIRAILFIVCEGVMPSGKGRGYVLRRLMRRLIAASLKLKIDITDDVYFADLTEAMVSAYATVYPEVEENKEKVIQLLCVESKKYQRAITTGKKEWGKVFAARGYVR